jgi:hypothetical protein
MRLRDMGLTSKKLIEEAGNAGIKISNRRASEIINGQTFIRQDELEIIAKILNRTVDSLYIDLGSVMAAICPLLSSGRAEPLLCCRQQCAWWDWQMQWCTIKSINTMIRP